MAIILLLDDDIEVRRSMRTVLEHAGHDVREADSVPSALYLLTVASVEAVITDLGLAGQYGMELVRRLREHHPRLPVITIGAVADGRALGAAAALDKGIAPGAVLLAVETVLQGDRKPEEPKPEIPPTRMTLRLLLAEDSDDDAELVARELEREGYDLTYERVDTRETMSDALDREEWDLVIGDYSMPRFRGTAALALLHERGLDVPFIFFSGTISDEVAQEAMRAGARDFVRKGDFERLMPAVARELREAHAPDHGSETVLVVDDISVVRRMTRRMLERQGYTVLEAESGNAALAVAAAHRGPIDLLLTDVTMPELDGPALAGRLRTDRPEMKVLFMSGYGADAIAVHGITATSVPYLQKPFTPAGLGSKVRGVLDGK